MLYVITIPYVVQKNQKSVKIVKHKAIKPFHIEIQAFWWYKFLEDLCKQPFDNIGNINDTSKALETWYSLFLEILNKHATEVQRRIKRHIESNTGKSARQGNLIRGCQRFPCLALFTGVWFYFSPFINSCVLFDSYVLLADDHVSNVSYFPFMSIKKVIPYFCVLREGYCVIIWLLLGFVCL